MTKTFEEYYGIEPEFKFYPEAYHIWHNRLDAWQKSAKQENKRIVKKLKSFKAGHMGYNLILNALIVEIEQEEV